MFKQEEPKKPYVHQDYPALRYKESGHFVKVNDAEEDKLAEAAGFTNTPPEPGVECVAVGALTAQKAPKPRREQTEPAAQQRGPAGPPNRR